MGTGNVASRVGNQIQRGSLEILDQFRVVVVVAAAHMMAGHGKVNRSADSPRGS
jgi:hypothetical protein